MDFKIGDKVVHKSNPSIIWVIESIEGNEALCSTVLEGSLEQKKSRFNLSVLDIYSSPQFLSIAKPSNKNRF